jgi:hypothetical protein
MNFPSTASAVALIDRVVHHAEVILLERRELQTSGGRGEPAAEGLAAMNRIMHF